MYQMYQNHLEYQNGLHDLEIIMIVIISNRKV